MKFIMPSDKKPELSGLRDKLIMQSRFIFIKKNPCWAKHALSRYFDKTFDVKETQHHPPKKQNTYIFVETIELILVFYLRSL